MLNKTILNVLNSHAQKLEEMLEGDVLAFNGAIQISCVKDFRNAIESLSARRPDRKRLIVVLTSPGGHAEATEDMVDIMRHHYKEVFFVVPDYAQSAGTILCMSGDKIYMDYSSALGPIDPQVWIETPGKVGQFVPALGYLDKVNELVEKSRDNTITPAEFEILRSQDLAMLRRYEQARDLSDALLKEWLVKYKFKDWKIHENNKDKIGNEVTESEREERAGQIASILSNNNQWHSHGRRIGINTLRTVLRLKIEDYGEDEDLQKTIRVYNDVMADYVVQQRIPLFIHTAEDGV